VRINEILLIEDDPAFAQSLKEGLERDGYGVTWKTTGMEGIAYARDRQPHLILLDIRLPDLSGFDVCREIRLLGLRQAVIMLTARGEEMDKPSPSYRMPAPRLWVMSIYSFGGKT
jgi:DNA-binding response OmpR family regulator